MSHVHVYRYWNEGTKDHFYTANAGEIGTTQHGASGNHGYKCEGKSFSVSSVPHAGLVPVYRYWKAATSDHFYTTNAAEIGATNPGQTGNHGYTCEGILGYIAPAPTGGKPVYRYWNAGSNDHFYTKNAGEIGATNPGQTGNHGYTCEGILGYSVPSTVPIYRYWNAGSHDHFYTENAGEIGTTQHGQTGNHGYTSEGVSFHLAKKHKHGLVPVYRYWKAGTSDHFYTTNAGEIGATNKGQTGNHGYACEGVIGYISPIPGPGLIPVYRYWNAGTNDHFYTANAAEIGATNSGQTGNHGYTCEGVLGYSFSS